MIWIWIPYNHSDDWNHLNKFLRNIFFGHMITWAKPANENYTCWVWWKCQGSIFSSTALGLWLIHVVCVFFLSFLNGQKIYFKCFQVVNKYEFSYYDLCYNIFCWWSFHRKKGIYNSMVIFRIKTALLAHRVLPQPP